MSLSNRLASAMNESVDPTVLEYAVQEMMKGKSPATAAKNTAKKLSGGTNVFIGGGSQVEIDVKALESAIWDRVADRCVVILTKHTKPGQEQSALAATAFYYKQMDITEPAPPKFVAELRKRVAARLGRDPFGAAS